MMMGLADTRGAIDYEVLKDNSYFIWFAIIQACGNEDMNDNLITNILTIRPDLLDIKDTNNISTLAHLLNMNNQSVSNTPYSLSLAFISHLILF